MYDYRGFYFVFFGGGGVVQLNVELTLSFFLLPLSSSLFLHLSEDPQSLTFTTQICRFTPLFMEILEK